MDELRKTYNQIAQKFADEHSLDTWDDDYIEQFVKALPEGSTVLDLGCGAGNDSFTLSNNHLKVTGLDLADEFIKIAIESYGSQGIAFIRGDMRHLPFSDNSFDGVFAKASLLHIPKAEVPLVLGEIRRVLKPEGIVHIAIKGGEGEGNISEDDYGDTYTRFFSYWKMEPFVALLNKHDFQIINQNVWRQSVDSYTTWLKVLAKNQKRAY